jgi:16S rRNA (uracil1498-N3)-methyltransferase
VTLRLYVDSPLHAGQALELPPGPARHVQVRRLQPGDALRLFDGCGGEWAARVVRIGRQQVGVEVGTHIAVEREAAPAVTVALGMPANDRMDWLVEKATELGAAAIQPLTTARSVLRLDGERAERKRAHWHAIAVAAAEQCGRTRVPAVQLPVALSTWLGAAGPRLSGYLLCVPKDEGGSDAMEKAASGDVADAIDTAEAAAEAASAAAAAAADPAAVAVPMVTVLSGPEGGLTEDEQRQAIDHGLRLWSLGPRVLRAETAPLAALVLLTLGVRPAR